MEIRANLISEMEHYTPSEVVKNEVINKPIEEHNEISLKEIDDAVNKLNERLKSEETYAEYSVHEKFGDIMIRIVSKDTKEVLLEVPPKKILDYVARMCENSGIMLDKKV